MVAARSLLLALPAVALAQEQIPLMDKVKGWFNQATASVSSGAGEAASSASSAAPEVPTDDPVEAAAAKAADIVVSPITLENFQTVLKPNADAAISGDAPQEWVIFIDGGNTTCHGLCGNATKAWTKAVPLIAAAPNPPNLGYIDCDENQIMCNVWAAGPPTIYHLSIPQPLPDQTQPPTTAHYVHLNRQNVTASDIADLYIKGQFKEFKTYEGAFHPIDGWVIQTGLAIPWAYVMWAFAKMPNWLPMLAVSFLSRTIMGRRTQQPRPQAGAAPAGPPAAGQ